MFRYKIVENILYNKLYSRELVDKIFYFMYPNNSKKHILYIENRVVIEKNYKTIISLYMNNIYKTEFMITRCVKCFHIISFKKHHDNKVINLFNYIDCVEHNKKLHKLEQKFENTILYYIEKLNSNN